MTKEEVILALKDILKQWDDGKITDRHAIIMVAMAVNFGLED